MHKFCGNILNFTRSPKNCRFLHFLCSHRALQRPCASPSPWRRRPPGWLASCCCSDTATTAASRPAETTSDGFSLRQILAVAGFFAGFLGGAVLHLHGLDLGLQLQLNGGRVQMAHLLTSEVPRGRDKQEADAVLGCHGLQIRRRWLGNSERPDLLSRCSYHKAALSHHLVSMHLGEAREFGS